MRPSCSIVVAPGADLTSLATLALSSTATEVVEILLVGDAACAAQSASTAAAATSEASRRELASAPAAAAAAARAAAATTATAPTPAAVACAAGAASILVAAASAQAGFAGAANAGGYAALGQYVLFLDSGVRARADVVDVLVREAERSGRGAVFGGKVIGPGDTVVEAGVVLDHEGSPRRRYAGFPGGHPAVNRTRRLQLVSGACMLVRREVFVETGGFDTALAAEDAAYDFCLRVGARGHEVHYVHDAVAVVGAGAIGGVQGLDRDDLTTRRRSRRLFRTRWLHTAQADDVACYQQDGLLRMQYDDMGLQVRAVVVPPFEAAGDSASGSATERLLSARAQQVGALLDENARLASRVAVLEAAIKAATVTGSGISADATNRAFDELMPPPDLEMSVGGQFREVGDEFFTYFTEIGGLRPDDRVLDVGCGTGRMAVPLTRYLAEPGSYDGFDITARAIAWCQTQITPRFPHFRFQYFPLRNDAYNTQATQPAAAFQFPYPQDSFDFVFLTSVFTHLLPDAAQQYIAQIAAVLKPGGRCFSTFFLLNPESTGLIQAGLSPQFPFAHRRDDGCRVLDANAPEAAIAYDEARIRAWFGAAGLAIADPVRYGCWCGRADGLSLQDIVLAVKA